MSGRRGDINGLFAWGADSGEPGGRPFPFRHRAAAEPELGPGPLGDVSARAADGPIDLARDPAFRHLLAAYGRAIEAAFPALARASAPVFTAALIRTSSGKPAHIGGDAAAGFLLQIVGTQAATVGDGRPPSMYELEAFYLRGDARPAAAPDASAFVLAPGDGVYQPPFAPAVLTGTDGAPSLAIRIGALTAAARRDADVHRVNALLRLIGVDATPPGRRPAVDRVKRLAGDVVRRAEHVAARARG